MDNSQQPTSRRAWSRLRGLFHREARESQVETEPTDSPTGLSKETVLAINFVAEAGKQMLESSTSVAEVVDRLRRFLPAVGLEGAAIDANLYALTLSYWKPGQPAPLTTMQVVEATRPRLERFAGAASLLDRVERGDMEVAAAYDELRALRRAPRMRREYVRAAIILSVLGWVLFFNGLTLTTVLVALLTTVLTFPIEATVSRLRMPRITITILAAIVLAAVPNALAGAGLEFALSAAVVAGLFVHLPGRALVSAVIDGLNSAPISAMARAFEAMTTAGALAFGVILGGSIGAGLGVELSIDAAAVPLWLSVPGAAIGVLGLAVAWGMPRACMLPTVGIGAVAWLIVALSTHGGGSNWAASFGAAVVVGFFGVLVAYLQGGSASVYTGVAIIPLVPGFTLYQAMLALTQGTGESAERLTDALVVSLAIAGGVAIGLALGRNLQAVGTWVAARRRR